MRPIINGPVRDFYKRSTQKHFLQKKKQGKVCWHSYFWYVCDQRFIRYWSWTHDKTITKKVVVTLSSNCVCITNKLIWYLAHLHCTAKTLCSTCTGTISGLRSAEMVKVVVKPQAWQVNSKYYQLSSKIEICPWNFRLVEFLFCRPQQQQHSRQGAKKQDQGKNIFQATK